MISIITVCHKSSSLMAGYVSSFLRHNKALANSNLVEFILVENSGDFGTEAIATQLRDNGFKAHVTMEENRGFGSGCNTGARLARGRLLVFANPDIEFLTPIIDLEKIFTRNIWGTVRQVSNNSVSAFDLLPEYKSLATEFLHPFRFLHLLPILSRYCYPVGAFLIIPRDAFFQVSGFDERFFLYHEESELSRRLTSKFGPPFYTDKVSIVHEVFGTQSNSDFTFQEEARGFVTYCKVTQQEDLLKSRMKTLRLFSFFSHTAKKRHIQLQKAMREHQSETT